MKPYKKWYLKVSSYHKIYYECIWNKKSTPILYLHWWPWSWFKSKNRKTFDLEKDNVIFFDQRWAWKSKFSWWDVLVENSTDFLVDDINKLLDFLDIKKTVLFWWSWWSTLTLVYAIRNPKRVISMILRGVYLWWVNIKEDFLLWNWNHKFFPEEWEELLKYFPENIRKDKKKMADYVWKEYLRWNTKALCALNLYEWKLLSLDWNKKKDYSIETYDDKSIRNALIEFYYIYNSCFITKDYILNNSSKIENIKTYIIHWRYDNVCPPEYAYFLHKKLKKSKLHFTIAGHSSSDKENKKAIKESLKDLRKKLFDK